MRPAPAVLALVAAAVSIGIAWTGPARGGASGRPLVLVVHGRGQLDRDSASLRHDALEALQAGARTVSGSAVLVEDDVRIVWYADLLAERVTATACEPEATRPNTTAGRPSPLNVIAMIAGALLDVAAIGVSAAGDSATDTTSIAELRSLAGDLHFFGDAGTRCAVERRVGDALARARREQRPVVLVAHSLGGLVAWSHLRRGVTSSGADPSTAPAEVYRLVTIGSPLGSADVRRLVFGDERAPVPLPSMARSWVNVVAANDPFASRVTDHIGDPSGSAWIVDEIAESAHDDPHGLLDYLRDPATARAVVGAWCEAASQSDAACTSLTHAAR